MSKMALSIYLLKTNIENFTDAINSEDLQQFDVVSGQGLLGTIWLGHSPAHTPAWLDKFDGLVVPLQNRYTNSSVTGLYCVDAVGRKFVVAFGHGWQRVRKGSVEPNFGLRCVLNLCDEDQLRALKRDRVATDFLQVMEQVPDHGDIFRFGIETDKDILRAVRAGTDGLSGFGTNISGGDSFKFSIEFDVPDLPQILQRSLKTFGRQTYKQHFDWIDNVQPVRDEALVQSLNSELASKLSQSDPAVVMCAPEMTDWDGCDYFVFGRRCKNEVHTDLNVASWISYAHGKHVQIDSDALDSQFVHGLKEGVPGYDQTWRLKECLHATIVHNGETFLAHGGSWFRLEQDFVKKTNDEIGKLVAPTLQVPLPQARFAQKEGDYNKIAVRSSGRYFCLLDKKMIFHGGGQSKFELCDILSTDLHLISVKRWSGASSSLSHLFSRSLLAVASLGMMANSGKKWKGN